MRQRDCEGGMLNQLRMLLAEGLLRIVISVAPRNAEGLRLIRHLDVYCVSAMAALSPQPRTRKKEGDDAE